MAKEGRRTDDCDESNGHLHDTPTSWTFGAGKESNHGQMTREGGFPRHVSLSLLMDSTTILEVEVRRYVQVESAEVIL